MIPYILYPDGTVYRKSTLAHFLDKREIAYDEPNFVHLPDKCNLMQFLVEQLLQAHTISIRIKESAIQQDLTQCLHHLRDCVPAGDRVFVTLECNPVSDKIATNDFQEVVTTTSVLQVTDTFSGDSIHDQSNYDSGW